MRDNLNARAPVGTLSFSRQNIFMFFSSVIPGDLVNIHVFKRQDGASKVFDQHVEALGPLVVEQGHIQKAHGHVFL